MLRSMTGFAQVQSEIHGEREEVSYRVCCSLKSVNARFLEIVTKLPESLSSSEVVIRRLLQERFHRGRVECILTLEQVRSGQYRLTINQSVLSAIMDAEESLLQQRPHKKHRRAPLTLDTLLKWPGIVEEERHAIEIADREPIVHAIVPLIQQAIQSLALMRSNEGESLTRILQDSLTELDLLVAQVIERLPEVRKRLELRLRERIAEFVSETVVTAAVDSNRFAQEMALMFNRADISEELDRLRAHVAEVRTLLGCSEPVGRRLDFLCQELNRETNTLCSKSQDIVMSRLGVDMKVIVEKLREQIQNVE
ncbi:MAG: YicC family protein [Magnetococcales bacterium]|nr:YicC family protein [Magnetococcales bacterium]